MFDVVLMGIVCLAGGQTTAATPPANFSGTWTMTSLVVNPKP
jgi:hypothetical protein